MRIGATRGKMHPMRQVRIHDELATRVERLAKSEQRTLPWMVNALLARALELTPRPPKRDAVPVRRSIK